MGRKVLILLMVCVMLTVFSRATQASIAYVEGFMSADFETNYVKGDSTAVLFGTEFQFDRFKAGFENLFASLTVKEGLMVNPGEELDGSVAAYQVKAGYRLVDNGTLSLDGTMSYNYQNCEIAGQVIDVTGYSLGADLNYLFSERSSLLVSIGYSIDGDFDMAYEGLQMEKGDASFYNYLMKYNYLFGENYGVSLAYRTYKTSVDSQGEKADFDINGFTLGFSYSF